MFKVGENWTRVGLVTFNEKVTLQFNLTRYFQKEHILNAIDRIEEGYGYATATDMALSYARDYLFEEKVSFITYIAALLCDKDGFLVSIIACF